MLSVSWNHPLNNRANFIIWTIGKIFTASSEWEEIGSFHSLSWVRDGGSDTTGLGRPEYCTVQMERDLGTVAGSMVTEQRVGASWILYWWKGNWVQQLVPWLQNRGLGRPEYCTDGKGSGYSSWFHGYRAEVCGVQCTVLMERDLGTVAGSMVTEQRFAASWILYWWKGIWVQ